jgi:hypothetical protein
VPNCDFYATPEDHKPFLDWLFAEGACVVHELESAFDQQLQQFASTAEILAQFERRYTNGKPWHTVYLQLYVLGTGPPFVPRRIALDPGACDGATFKYRAEGWGLVQLYLAAARDGQLHNSHTNHNSQLRAEKWAQAESAQPGPDAWDFAKVNAFSSRLNRQIKKHAAAKIGSRAVLPGALKEWEAGVSLWPYQPGKYSLQRL